MERGFRRGVLGGAAGAALLAAAFGPSAFEAADTGAPEPVLSLLAVGDAGEVPGFAPSLDSQRAVGRSLEREHRRAPVNGVVFLGDNFYENGLVREDMVERLRDNVVLPYCGLVELAGPRSAEVQGACPSASEASAPRPPLYAVLGNHDVETEEGRRLQTEEVALYVSNWRMPAETAAVFELGSGVSLVLFDSNRLLDGGDPGPLRDALRAARGPWRVIAAHHPIGTSRDDDYTRREGVGEYGETVLQAIREADVDVHLMLAGHEHNLQLLRVDPPSPRLVVVSGAGALPKEIKSKSRARLFKHEGLGFARVDLVRDAFGERLAVTLFGAPHWGSLVGLAPEVLARWSVRADGELLREPIAVRRAGLL
jgi:hypothetical protein